MARNSLYDDLTNCSDSAQTPQKDPASDTKSRELEFLIVATTCKAAELARVRDIEATLASPIPPKTDQISPLDRVTRITIPHLYQGASPELCGGAKEVLAQRGFEVLQAKDFARCKVLRNLPSSTGLEELR